MLPFLYPSWEVSDITIELWQLSLVVEITFGLDRGGGAAGDISGVVSGVSQMDLCGVLVEVALGRLFMITI